MKTSLTEFFIPRERAARPGGRSPNSDSKPASDPPTRPSRVCHPCGPALLTSTPAAPVPAAPGNSNPGMNRAASKSKFLSVSTRAWLGKAIIAGLVMVCSSIRALAAPCTPPVCIPPAGFTWWNPSCVCNVQLVAYSLIHPPVDGLVKYFGVTPYMFITQQDLGLIYFFDISNPCTFPIAAANITYCGPLHPHAIVMTASGRIFFTDKVANNVGEVTLLNNIVCGSAGSTACSPGWTFTPPRCPDGIAYSPTRTPPLGSTGPGTVTVAVNFGPFPEFYDLIIGAPCPAGVSIQATLVCTLNIASIGVPDFIDHIEYKASSSDIVYLAGQTTGNLWRWDRSAPSGCQFCVMGTVPGGSFGPDGVASYVGNDKPSCGIFKGPVFNHNLGTVINIRDQGPCPNLTYPPMTILSGGTRGDGIFTDGVGYYYSVQHDTVTRFTIDPQGSASELLGNTALFVKPGSSTLANLESALLTGREEGMISPQGFADSLDIRAVQLIKALKDGDAKRARTAVTELKKSIENGLRLGHFNPPGAGQTLEIILETMLAELGGSSTFPVVKGGGNELEAPTPEN